MSLEYWLNKESISGAYLFVTESNSIEGIRRQPSEEEVKEHERFITLDTITIPELERFVSVYQSDAKLRDKKGMDVRVGSYFPPKGGQHIKKELEYLLNNIEYKIHHPDPNYCFYTPFESHTAYENLHPFTDCNGRSGRALWAWHMKKKGLDMSLGFLHAFYYQALEGSR